MLHLLLLTVFIAIMACLQANYSRNVAVYNSHITEAMPHRKDSGIFMIIAMVIMALLVAMRSVNVGNDTAEYIRIFSEINSNSDYASITRFEVGYVFLNRLVGKFTSNAQGVFVVCAVIQYTIFIWFIKKHSKNYALTLMLFFFFIFGNTLNIVRQSLAMAFVLVAFDRTLDKKTLGAIFWIIIAFLFHKSAIIMLLIVFLPYVKFDKFLVVIILFACVLMAFTDLMYKICQIILPSYAHYFGGQYSESGWLAVTYQMLSGLAFFIVTSLAVWFSKSRSMTIIESGRLGVKRQSNLVLWISFAAFAGYILGYKINLVDRLVSYFSMFTILLVPNALQKYNKTSRMAISVVMVMLLISYSFITAKLRPEWNTIYPYTFFWQIGG